MRAEPAAPAAAACPEAEYLAIRRGAGISDLTDTGKLRVTGPAAAELLDEVLAADVSRLVETGIRWTALLDQAGRVLADVQVHRDHDHYLVTCAGSRRDLVLETLLGHRAGDVEVEDVSAALAAFSVEGPVARDLPTAVGGVEAGGLPLLRLTHCDIAGADVTVARIGYTGEFGFVFHVEPHDVEAVVGRVREATPGLVPCGRAVQDVLRLEVRSFNPNRDLLDGATALEAGLHWMIDFRKPRFLGREAVLAEKARGPARRLVAFVLEGTGAVARGAVVKDEGRPVGAVANAARSPALDRTIGLAYVAPDWAWVGVELDVAGGRARIVSAPFILTESTRLAAE